MFAAVYLDGGITAASELIHRVLLDVEREEVVEERRRDYKLSLIHIFTMPLVVEMPGRCPKCGGRLFKRTGTSRKSGKQYTYYCCEHTNNRAVGGATCDFMTWDVPVKDDCPLCGKTLFKRAGRGYKRPYCINPECANFLPEDVYKRQMWISSACIPSTA